MIKMPKRKKSKDNPYKIVYQDDENKYICIFRDSRNNLQFVELTLEVFNALNEFELEDISQMHKFDKHIEHSELYESTLNKRMTKNDDSFEEKIERKIMVETIINEIMYLPEMQKKRMIKYFFENKTLSEIAEEEHCSKVAVKYSIDIAIEKISKKIKI